MKIYIIDASVILSFLLSQKSHPHVKKYFINLLALAKKSKVEIYSVPFLKIEVANGLRFNEAENTIVSTILQDFFEFPIKYYPLANKDIAEILKLSIDLQTTVYDTSYHFLALLLDGIFLTCDQEYYRKASKLEHIELVK